MGVLLTDGFSPSLFTSRPSSDGVESPVVVTKYRWSTSRGSSPARASPSRTARSPTSSATRMYASFRFPKVSRPGYSASGSARYRPATSAARWIWPSRSPLKCCCAQKALSAAVSVSWSA